MNESCDFFRAKKGSTAQSGSGFRRTLPDAGVWKLDPADGQRASGQCTGQENVKAVTPRRRVCQRPTSSHRSARTLAQSTLLLPSLLRRRHPLLAVAVGCDHVFSVVIFGRQPGHRGKAMAHEEHAGDDYVGQDDARILDA